MIHNKINQLQQYTGQIYINTIIDKLIKNIYNFFKPQICF